MGKWQIEVGLSFDGLVYLVLCLHVFPLFSFSRQSSNFFVFGVYAHIRTTVSAHGGLSAVSGICTTINRKIWPNQISRSDLQGMNVLMSLDL